MRRVKRKIRKIIKIINNWFLNVKKIFVKEKEYISKPKELLKIKGNKFLGVLPIMDETKITFKGKNNILYCEEGVHLDNCVINFECNNSVIYLSKNKYDYRVKIDIRNNSVCFIGKDCFFNNMTNIFMSEEKNVIIGNGCLFSLNVCMRLADPHLIYDCFTHERINPSKSIYIGDHVWIGQDTLLLKGTNIGSGTIVGANSVVSNKTLKSNSIYVGNKLKLQRENIFWDERIVNRWTKVQTEKNQFNYDDKYIFKKSKTNNFKKIENTLNKLEKSNEKLKYISNKMSKKDVNRFSVFE